MGDGRLRGVTAEVADTFFFHTYYRALRKRKCLIPTGRPRWRGARNRSGRPGPAQPGSDTAEQPLDTFQSDSDESGSWATFFTEHLDGGSGRWLTGRATRTSSFLPPGQGTAQVTVDPRLTPFPWKPNDCGLLGPTAPL